MTMLINISIPNIKEQRYENSHNDIKLNSSINGTSSKQSISMRAFLKLWRSKRKLFHIRKTSKLSVWQFWTSYLLQIMFLFLWNTNKLQYSKVLEKSLPSYIYINWKLPLQKFISHKEHPSLNLFIITIQNLFKLDTTNWLYLWWF